MQSRNTQKWVVISKRADFQAIGQKYNIDQVTARIIRNRDVIEDRDIYKFLKGSKEDLYDPHMLYESDKLVSILIDKIRTGKKIRIIGDYDIDGVMSTYILLSGLRKCNAVVDAVIPDRIKDGYGLNINLIDQAKEDKVDTILTCDNGIAAMNEIAHAKELGITVLVTDHHEIPYEEVQGEKSYLRSEADAIVNPHQICCNYPFKDLCGAAVAWKIIQLTYEAMGIPVEKADDFLENVAFATVGDIMNLVDENRILVKEGLKKIHNTKNNGMKALISQCGLVPEQIDSYHFGFVLGPCINASGRLDTAKRALGLFLTEDYDEAVTIASELVTLNNERKDLTLEGVEMAKAIYEKEDYSGDTVVVIYLPEVHESIAGIIAGRIRELYGKPTYILTKATEGAKGSGRSVEAYSMYDELCKCKALLSKFGGHPMAAGLSLPVENIDELRNRLNGYSCLTEEDLTEKVKIDVPMPVTYVTMDLVRELEILAPFGKANPKPVFADKNLSISKMWVMGKNKNVVKLNMQTETGMVATGIYFGDVEGFMDYLREKFGDKAVEDALMGRYNNIRISLVYSPKINSFRDNENLQFEIHNYQ